MSLLQRRLGREPNGLLRYSGIMTHGLVEGILEGFWGLGRPETMEVIIRDDPLRSYMVVDHPYALSFQTPVSSRAVSVDMLKRRLAGNQPLLVRKFFEDLSEGRKIFVFQRRDPTTRPEADAVLAALSVWGECTLLWVVQDAALAGGVKRLGPRLMQGFVDYSGTRDGRVGRKLAADADECVAGKGSSSFLKKRTKKLLLITSGLRSALATQMQLVTSKSFLVLFFKKELLPCLLMSRQPRRGARP